MIVQVGIAVFTQAPRSRSNRPPPALRSLAGGSPVTARPVPLCPQSCPDELAALLKRLRLAHALRAKHEVIERAEREDWTFHEFLLALAREEVAHRAQTRILRRVRKARFPDLKTIEQFDFSVQPAVLARDELGYLTDGPDAANVLHRVVNARCIQRRSLLFTTTNPLRDRSAAPRDCGRAEAILDCILEGGRMEALEGPSIRRREGIDYEL